MNSRVWRGYLLFVVVAVAVYPLLPRGIWKGDVFFDLFGVIAVVAVVCAVCWNRPRHRLPWLLLAAGQGLFVLGDLSFSVYARVLDQTPFPSVADGLYLAGYPVLAVGLMLLVRRRRPGQDWPGLLDAGIVAVGLGSISWVLLMAPYLRDRTLSLPGLSISLAYPLADVLLLAVTARLLFGGGRRSLSLVLVGVSLAVLLVTDSVYGWLNLHNAYASGDLVDVGWMLSYGLFGVAALHPSMVRTSDRVRSASVRFAVWRLALLALALVAVPVGLAVESIRGGAIDIKMFAVAGLLLSVLSLARLGGVIRVNERALSREAVLRHAGAALVQASDVDAIHAAGVHAALALAQDERTSSLLALGRPDRMRLAASGGALSQRTGDELPHLPVDAQVGLARGEALEVPGLLLGGSSGAAMMGRLCPLFVGDRFVGVLGLQSVGHLSSQGGDALEVLAGQVSQALESHELTSEVFRRRGEERFRSLVQNSSDLIVVVDPDLRVGFQTPSVETLLGYRQGDLEGRALSEIAYEPDVLGLRSLVVESIESPEGSPGRELRLRCRDGSFLLFELVANNLLADPNIAGIVLTGHDVTKRFELEEQLRRKAFEDGLTALPNGELFRNRLEHALKRRGERTVAVLFIDLDDFKAVNDSLGHGIGDALLIEAGKRLGSSLRAGDTAARLGGDEFVVLLDDLADHAQAASFARRIVDTFAAPFTIEANAFHCSASVGLAVPAPDDNDPERLIHQADLAMYQAKRSGKACSVVFDPAMEAGVIDRLERVTELRHALDRDEIVVHYQPIVDLKTGSVVGLEALARWHHPKRGLIAPDDFIPLAEQTGLIIPLGRSVLEQACRQARAWQHTSPAQPRLWLSVNLSVHQLRHPTLISDLERTLVDSGLEPADLVLELTETAVAENAEAMIATLTKLKQLGVRLAIDDFGVGYSGLSYLRDLPVDFVKIDKKFIDDLEGDTDNSKLAKSVIQLGRILHLQVIAEGIEAPQQSRELRDLNCLFGQGYLHGSPLDSDQTAALLSKQHEAKTAAA